MKVVIRYFGIFNTYGICHASSYQSAFRSTVNNFSSREEATEFCNSHGCVIERHSHDPLQS